MKKQYTPAQIEVIKTLPRSFGKIDLFEDFDLIPQPLKSILDKWEKRHPEGLNYIQCAEMLKDVEKVGYTFDYGLSAEPINLRKKGKPAKY